MAVLSLNPWMLVSFLLATYAVVANDSLQTLGTFIGSNQGQTPKSWQVLFISSITLVVLMLGWHLHGGDPAWGRLESFPVPDPFSWVYVLPPVTVLVLTVWGAPVSTSLLLLACVAPGHSGQLVGRSLGGYGFAFITGLITWGGGRWGMKRWVVQPDQGGLSTKAAWRGLQWCSTGLLWSVWLVQDLANLFVFVPRHLALEPMLACSLLLCLGTGVLVACNGGPLQAVLANKTNSSDLRSATVIDAMLGLCLLLEAVLSPFPLSTTWVFLGLLAGREVAIRITHHQMSAPIPDHGTQALAGVIGRDLYKAGIGLGVSLGIGFSLQPLIRWSGG